MDNTIRIGCWIPESKKKKIKYDRFVELCRQSGACIVELDLSKPLADQGPFDVILHKISDDVLMRAEYCNDLEARDQVLNFKNYVANHPQMPVLDDLSKINRLKNRTTMFHILQEYQNKLQNPSVFVPSFTEITSPQDGDSFKRIRDAGVTFPCVCKPSSAHNAAVAHNMSLVFNESGLKDVSYPCVAQSFVNHNGVLFKVFVVGSKTFIARRPSIKNQTTCDQSTIHFRTQDVSKPHSRNYLNADLAEAGDHPEPDASLMHEVGQAMRSALGINIMGVDVIMEINTGRYGLIDVNAFPGFQDIPNIQEVLRDYVMELAYSYRNKNNAPVIS